MNNISFKNETQEIIYQELKEKYRSHHLTKKELANEMGVSTVTIDKRLKSKTELPPYRKASAKEGSKQNNYRVTFHIYDVSLYLSSIRVLTHY